MPKKIRIRRAAAGDADVLLGLIDSLADYERLDRPTVDARQRLLRDGFGPSPRFEAYLAELDGEVVGYAITFETYSTFLALPTLYLEDLFVLPEFRRSGVGTALFRQLAGEAVRRDAGRMEWAVLDWNEPAIDFYERIGAERLREWQTYRLSSDALRRIAGPTPETGGR